MDEAAAELVWNPAHFFEWSNDEMVAACEHEILHGIIASLQDRPLVDVLRRSVRTMKERMLGNYDRPSSSSPAHNATMICKMEARANWLPKLEQMLARIEEANKSDVATVSASYVCELPAAK